MKLLAKKSLGQHFLNSKHVLEQIISAAEIKEGETVLEIGPGTGILTEALLAAGAKVLAVEKDSRSVVLIKEKFVNEIASRQLKLVEGDILDQEIFNFQFSIFNEFSNSNKEYSIVANIPYYITGAILEKFLENEPRPKRMVLLVQKEVADRIVARDQKESILSISVKAFGTPKLIAKVPKGAFSPPPTVDSAILAISDIAVKPFIENKIDIKRFFEIVKTGFAHKRKFLIRNLENVVETAELKKIWLKLGLNEKVRAEDLATQTWFKITAEVGPRL